MAQFNSRNLIVLYCLLLALVLEAGTSSINARSELITSVTNQEAIDFPRGTYWTTKPDHLDKAVTEGFNFLNFAYDTEESFNDEKINITAMLERADELNISVIFGLGYFVERSDWENLTLLVNHLKNYQCIKIWELVDEPSGDKESASQLVQAAEIVRSIDSRPLFIQHSPSSLRQWENEYCNLSDAVDFLSVDPYPSFPGRNYSYVTSELEFLSGLNNGRVPYFTVLKAYAPHPDSLPRPVDLWYQTLLALQSNTSGIFYFFHGDYNTTEFPLVGIWDNLTLVSAMSDILAPLEHFCIDNNPTTNITVEGTVTIYQKELSGKKIALVLTDKMYTWDGSNFNWNPQIVQLTVDIPEWETSTVEIKLYSLDGNSSETTSPVDREFVFDVTFQSGVILIIEWKETAINEFIHPLGYIQASLVIVIVFSKYYRKKKKKVHHYARR